MILLMLHKSSELVLHAGKVLVVLLQCICGVYAVKLMLMFV